MPSEAEIDALIERLGYHREHPLRGGYTLINPDGPEAAAFLAALRDERDRLERSAFQADEDERFCTDISEALGIEQKENARLKARVRELEQKLERARAAWTDGPIEQEIDRLRFEAFHTNGDSEKAAYYLATSKWFQDRHARATLAEIGQRE